MRLQAGLLFAGDRAQGEVDQRAGVKPAKEVTLQGLGSLLKA